MRKIGNTQITEIQYGVLKKMLTEFSEEYSECNDSCPFNVFNEEGDSDWPIEIDQIYEQTPMGWCVCNIFDEFKWNMDLNCPCHIYGKDAFRRLAIVVGKMKDPNAYKI